MLSVTVPELSVSLDPVRGEIVSLTLCGRERLADASPIFCLCLRDRAGAERRLTAYDAALRTEIAGGIRFASFAGESVSLCVTVTLQEMRGELDWRVRVEGVDTDHLVEWIDFPLVTLPLPAKNDAEGGRILYPYNEGALVDDIKLYEHAWFGYEEPAYPSKGSFGVFPNMVSSQMLSYHWSDAGLYMGAHDPARGVKGIDFYRAGRGVRMQMRLWCGVGYGENFLQNYPIVWACVGAHWESAAERYRQWNETHLPRGVKRIRENGALPAWYRDFPLVLTYPVRGLHDTDEMTPNRMYPYCNALPTVRRIAERTGERIMIALMHWEGTAPWAPPYVWPPYGGEEVFFDFRDALHKEGHMLGVYCSGFGYTLQSNLDEKYNREAEYEARGLSAAMCASPENRVQISNICTAQRRGLDICPASEEGKTLLWEAYRPLFESGIDYAQILDQNHGGGQYFCYSRDHGHPPAPGAWMTERMQEMLSEWNAAAPSMLFGCESAAAEPFIGNLQMSDNRFELNYHLGAPVPFYSYVYHEYLYNFMGNQVCAPFDETDDRSLWYRIAYAFSAGDSMTLVLDQDGNPKSRWGNLATDYIPDREKVLTLVSNLARLRRGPLGDVLFGGRMTVPPAVACETVTLHKNIGGLYRESDSVLPAVLCTAWEGRNGERISLLVNPTEKEQVCLVDGERICVPALDGCLRFAENTVS